MFQNYKMLQSCNVKGDFFNDSCLDASTYMKKIEFVVKSGKQFTTNFLTLRTSLKEGDRGW
jgi:hypothetical protein